MIYIVMAHDKYDDGSYVSAVFLNEEKAEKYRAIQDQLEDTYCYTIVKKLPADDTIDMNASVMEYFWYVIHHEGDNSIEEAEDYNTEEDKVRRIYDFKTDFTEVYKDRIEAFSIHSFEKAKELAIKEYKKTFENKRE